MEISNIRKAIFKKRWLLTLVVTVFCSACGSANDAVDVTSTGPLGTTEVIEVTEVIEMAEITEATEVIETSSSIEETEKVISAANFMTELYAALDGAVGDGEAIASVLLRGNNLCINVDFSCVDPAPLTLGDLAWSRASSITDAILTYAEYDELWETITIDFGEAGSVTCNKSDVVSSENGRYVPSAIFDSLLGF